MSPALIFLPFVAPICLWVAFSDMKLMKIPNLAVVALLLVYVIVGPFALPFGDYAWRYLNIVVILLFGFLLNQGGLIGAGDAKFAAAMAPFVSAAMVTNLVFIFAAVLIGAYATHRMFRAIPAVRNGFSDWKSWENPKFPMGLALAGCLFLYLSVVAWYGLVP
ncbi:MAG: prepilin peptidase [Pseudomonadota bacterium]